MITYYILSINCNGIHPNKKKQYSFFTFHNIQVFISVFKGLHSKIDLFEYSQNFYIKWNVEKKISLLSKNSTNNSHLMLQNIYYMINNAIGATDFQTKLVYYNISEFFFYEKWQFLTYNNASVAKQHSRIQFSQSFQFCGCLFHPYWIGNVLTQFF